MFILYPIPQSALLQRMYSLHSADTKCKIRVQSDWPCFVLFLWANENSSVGRSLEHCETRRWVPVFYVPSLQLPFWDGNFDTYVQSTDYGVDIGMKIKRIPVYK